MDAFNPKAVAYERVTGVPLGKGKASRRDRSRVTKGRNQSMASALTTDTSLGREAKAQLTFYLTEGPIGVTNN